MLAKLNQTKRWFLLLGWAAWACWAQAQTVHVAVASNFFMPMQQIAAQFTAQSGYHLALNTGSSGKLYAQIRNGAPFAVLLSADATTPAKLVQEGLAVANTQFTYALGRLALWSARAGVVDAQGLVLRQIPADTTKLALANPKLAPYGTAALAVLQNLGVQEMWSAHLVLGENIAQTYQFVDSENALLGFVALSQVYFSRHNNQDDAQGSLWVVPSGLYPPIQQDAVLLSAGKTQPGAQALMAFLRSAQMREIIRNFGYFTQF